MVMRSGPVLRGGPTASQLSAFLTPTTTFPNRMPYTQRGIANVRAGLADFKVAYVGDSIVAGAYADGTHIYTNGKALSTPSALAALLTASGITASNDSVAGDAGVAAQALNLSVYDTKIAQGASWPSSVTDLTAGGQMIINSAASLGSGADETLTWTPTASFDKCDVYYYDIASNGGFTVDCGGAVLLTVAQNTGANTIKKATVTKAAGTGVVNIIRTTTGSVAILGLHSYLTTAHRVHVINMGSGGTTTTNWNYSPAYGPLPTLALWAPHLTIIQLGINDAAAGISAATVAANLVAIAAVAAATGDVLLNLPIPCIASAATLANQAIVLAGIRQAGNTSNLNVLDLNTRLGTSAAALALGYMYTDQIHCVQLGYQDIADAVGQVLI